MTIKASDLQKDINGKFKNNQYPPSVEAVIESAQRYIKAIKDGRMCCVIESVSSSGMSRTMHFNSCEKDKHTKGFYYANYWTLFKLLGYKESKSRDGFVIHGCGMDMVFSTNYAIIHDLYRYGFLSSKECDVLAQRTPRVL
jgi:hypothetical protein